MLVKCRKCRRRVVEESDTPLLTVHETPVRRENIYREDPENRCDSGHAFYLQEAGLPQWILRSIEEGNWLRGKLHCPACSARLGSFDFVSGHKCDCGRSLLPPVHLVRSKVDCCLLDTTRQPTALL